LGGRETRALTLELTAAFLVLSTVAVLPFYALMMIVPRASVTRRVLSSLWSVAPPALVYLLFVVLIVLLTRPDVLDLWRALYIDSRLFSTQAVALLSNLHGTYPEMAILHGWAHLVVGDLFIARWAYWDALRRETPTWIIAAVVGLTGFLGPIGLVPYLLLRAHYGEDGVLAEPLRAGDSKT
jgi:hypothetical protein